MMASTSSLCLVETDVSKGLLTEAFNHCSHEVASGRPGSGGALGFSLPGREGHAASKLPEDRGCVSLAVHAQTR